MRISEHISFNEAIKSQHAIRLGITNIPNDDQISRMKLVAMKIFEPVREHFGRPIYISSFFRSGKLNTSIGGSTTSQHVTGEAIDIDCDSINDEIFHFIKDNLIFDQLIWEFGDDDAPAWVHVSYVGHSRNRGEVLKAYKKGGKTYYKLWNT